MKLSDIKDYSYRPDTLDMTNIFNVEETMANNGSVETFFNLNDGVVVDGINDLTVDQYTIYTCKANENLRFISYRIYGSQSYWWLIAKINGINDAFEELEAGRRLKLLNREHMNYIINLIHGKMTDNA